MAIDPRISLAGAAPLNVGQRFSGVLQNIQALDSIGRQRDLAPLQQQQAQMQTDLLAAQQPAQILAAEQASAPETQLIAQQQQQQQIATQYAQSLKPFLDSGDVQGLASQIAKNKQAFAQLGVDTAGIDDDLQQITTPEGLSALTQEVSSALQLGGLSQAKRPTQFGSQQTFKDDKGNLFFGTQARDPSTGSVETRFSSVSGDQSLRPEGQLSLVSGLGQTSEQQRAGELSAAREESDIAVSTAQRKAEATQRVKRGSDIKKELSERNRNAARSERTLRQALTLSQQADQGLSGAAKLQLGRLLPGIDASDEAALDATLNQLALDQLQNFKGPTTDFEFGVTQTIAGALGQSQASNIARIKSLDRARFFNEQEFKQFTNHIESGGDPDTFSFNFGEPVKTKKGVFTLQDIQDTAVQNNLTIEETIKRLNQ